MKGLLVTNDYDSLEKSDNIRVVYDRENDKVYVEKSFLMLYNFIDLGLPSGTKWADKNLGALKQEDVGLYFAWGETEGYKFDIKNNKILNYDGNESTKLFNWDDYKFSINGSDSNFSKYNTSDMKIILESEDDVVNKSNNLCFMANQIQFEELIDNTTSTFEILNGVKGKRLTGVNGNSIFIPFGGFLSNGSLNLPDYSLIWQSEISESGNRENAGDFNLNMTNIYLDSDNRCFGLNIRPIKVI